MDVIDQKPYLSVCIPAYEMNGQGRKFLKNSLEILCRQSFKNFEVVISDNSRDQSIENLCSEFSTQLSIRYIRNLLSFGISANLNNAIKNANGVIIKILFQDDYLYSHQSLEEIVVKFNVERDYWMITESEHSNDGASCYRRFTPKFSEKILLGVNTISSPSVLSIKNISSNPLFDENLTWLMDCDYYYQLYLAYGFPTIMYDVNIVNRTGPHQVSNSLVNRRMRSAEFRYLSKKYSNHLSIFSKFVLFLKYFR